MISPITSINGRHGDHVRTDKDCVVCGVMFTLKFRMNLKILMRVKDWLCMILCCLKNS